MAYLDALTLFTLFTLVIFHGYGEMIYEDGYMVKTVVDGNKLKINPHFAVSRPALHDLLLLDSSASVFYTLSFPLSQDSVPKRFTGNEKGYSDGDAVSAMFNKPRSFTVDLKGNAYVADRGNFAIRKISRSGVTTTIAGGISKTSGRADGPGRNVTFSADYELTFVPEMCALLIMDHGNKLIRLINLKKEDCGSPKSGLGNSLVWVSALIVPCLVGLVIGFAVRPYIMPHDGFNLLNVIKSWTIYLTKPGRQTPMPYFVTRNATVNSALSFLRQGVIMLVSQVTLMFGFCINKSKASCSCSSRSSSSTVSKNYVSLLDCDDSTTSEFVISEKYANQLKDLVAFEESREFPRLVENLSKQDDVVERDEIGHYQIDNMMQASITNFAEEGHRSTAFEGPFLVVSSVIKRK